MSDQWWRTSVLYQVYWRSFRDGNGDGLGDLEGLIQGLDHITSLGVDGIWINPMYPSPQRDHGYDVADYVGVDHRFGDLETFEAFLKACHARDLVVLLDIVPNHCSNEHPWFRSALASPEDPMRAWFHFLPGRGRDGNLPPNEWTSIFGGPAWTRIEEADGSLGPWYMHTFDASQPELNWNEPAVWDAMEDVLRFWFDRGVDGFRIDVAHGPIKAPDYPPITHPHDAFIERWDQPGIHEIYRRWRAIADSYDPPRVFLGEIHVETDERLMEYLGPEGLHLAFQFSFLKAEWTVESLGDIIRSALAFAASADAPATWVLSNHDEPRHLSRFAPTSPEGGLDLQRGAIRARSLLMVMLSLPGTVTLYNGEELGLPQVEDLADEVRQDPAFLRQPPGSTYKGRDGCRIPLPWSARQEHAGFSSVPPWLPMPSGWADHSVEQQEVDPASMLTFYRRILSLRRRTLRGRGTVEFVEAGAGLLAFRVHHEQEVHRICVNLSDAPARIESGAPGEVLRAESISDAWKARMLPPDGAIWTSWSL